MRAVDLKLAAVERNLTLSGISLSVSCCGSLIQLNELFLIAGAQKMLEADDYRSVVMSIPIVCAFPVWVTGQTQSTKITRVPVIYKLMMSTVVQTNWR